MDGWRAGYWGVTAYLLSWVFLPVMFFLADLHRGHGRMGG